MRSTPDAAPVADAEAHPPAEADSGGGARERRASGARGSGERGRSRSRMGRSRAGRTAAPVNPECCAVKRIREESDADPRSRSSTKSPLVAKGPLFFIKGL